MTDFYSSSVHRRADGSIDTERHAALAGTMRHTEIAATRRAVFRGARRLVARLLDAIAGVVAGPRRAL